MQASLNFLLQMSKRYLFQKPDVVLSVQYEGSPAARQALQKQVATCDIVVMSYETVRADIEWVAQRQWLYCVLDEGHIIRNPKAKLTEVLLSGQSLSALTISLSQDWSLMLRNGMACCPRVAYEQPASGVANG